MSADDLDEKLARIGRRVQAQRDGEKALLAQHPECAEFLAMAKAAFGIGREADGPGWYLDTGTEFAGSRVLAASVHASVPWTQYTRPKQRLVSEPEPYRPRTSTQGISRKKGKAAKVVT